MLPLMLLSFLLLRWPPTAIKVNALQEEDQTRSTWTPKNGQKASKIHRQKFEIINVRNLKKLSDEASKSDPEAQSGTKSGISKKKGTLSGTAPDEKHEPSNAQSSAGKIPPAKIKKEVHTSPKNAPSSENEWLLQVFHHLNHFDCMIMSVLTTLIEITEALATLFENIRFGPDLYGFPWETVICGTVLVLILICRIYLSITSRLSEAREKQLSNTIAKLIEENSQFLEKLSLQKQEYEELECILKDLNRLNLEQLTTKLELERKIEELNSCNSAVESETERLKKEFEEEKLKELERDYLLAEMQDKKESLENQAHFIELQIAEAKNILKIHEMNRERLEKSIQDTIAENNQLRESEQELLKEVEGWREQDRHLKDQAKVLHSSILDLENALKDNESQAKSLTKCLLKMVDWRWISGDQDDAEGLCCNDDGIADTENEEHLDDQKKQAVRKLIQAVQLNYCIKSMETQRSQLYVSLSDEKKTKEKLSKWAESLQKEHTMIQSENVHFKNEVQKLQQKLKAMLEWYQEIGLNLHRKLIVEEEKHLQTEEKLSVDGQAVEELNIYRQRAKDLEEELARSVFFYQHQVLAYEKKAHDNWLTAQATERLVISQRFKNAKYRQKLLKARLKFRVLKRDLVALNVPDEAFVTGHTYNKQPLPLQRPERIYFIPPKSSRRSASAPLQSSMFFSDLGDREESGTGPAMAWSRNQMEMPLNSSESN